MQRSVKKGLPFLRFVSKKESTIPDEAIQEFRAAWFLSFEKEITYEQAKLEVEKLLQIHCQLVRSKLNHKQP